MEQSAVGMRQPRRSPTSDAGKERRAAQRYPAPLMFCDVLSEEGMHQQADVMDCSMLGASLALTMRVEPGTVLRLQLSNQRQLCVRVVILRVVWRRGHAGGPWLVGGPFEHPLTPASLAALRS
jgi:hypothetical protein